MFEAELYPIYPSGKNIRANKTKPSRNEQKNLNDKNAKKKFIRKVNANFTESDLAVVLEYRPKDMPCCEEDASTDFYNYIKRIKTYRNKHELSKLKYMAVLETTVNKKTGLVSFHFHVIMLNMDRNTVEKLWTKADWTNCKRLQPNEFGLEALAKYMAKNPQGKKRWSQSKNLIDPEKLAKIKDGKYTKSDMHKIATIRVNEPAYFERKYKGYQFLKCEPVWNEFNSNWYITITMRKKE